MDITSIGLLAFCNGRRVVLDSLNQEAPGLFTVQAHERADKGLQWLQVDITNTSGKELVFSKAYISVILPPGPYEAFTQYNKWSHENEGSWLPLEGRGIIMNTANGRTTEGNSPYLAMRMIGQSRGLAFHVLPLGDWRIRVMPLPLSNHEPPVRVDLGISDELLAFRLAPGATWRLPEVMIQRFADFEEASGDLHAFLNRIGFCGYRPLPIEYNTWLDVYADLDVARLRRQLQAAKAVGCEVFVVDAGWFGPEFNGWGGVGDWREKEDAAFHGRMADFADEVRAEGLGFGFWIEPERFNANVPVVKEHPEWFHKADSGYRIELEIPEAYDYEKRTLFGLVRKYGATYIKTDMNGGLGIDETGAAHYHYARLFYHLMDELRQEFPDLVLECCASGALRTDLEALKHFDVFFPSDSSNPYTQTEMFIGMWRRFPPMKLMRWITLRELECEVPIIHKSPQVVVTPSEATWEEFFAVDLESVLAVSFFCGQYGFTGDLASLTEENRELVRKYVAEFKSFRMNPEKSESFCLFDAPAFKVMEMVRGDDAWLLVQYIASDALKSRTLYPTRLQANATYAINGQDYTGEQLMSAGFEFVPKYTLMHHKWRAELIRIVGV